MMDGYPIVKIICAPVCPDNEEETPSNPAEADSGQPAGNPVETAPSVTTLTAAAREYISNMTEDELIEHGHNEFNGKEQMFYAVVTMTKRASGPLAWNLVYRPSACVRSRLKQSAK